MANLRLTQDAGSHDVREATHLPSYISGYVDGEGCFNVSVAPRPTLRVGWELRPSLSVSQNADRSEVLYDIQQYFGCGSVRPDRSDHTLKWEIRSLELLVTRIIPHFRRYPMRSGKQVDFEFFAAVCERMGLGDHQHHAGLSDVLRLVAWMNPRGKRRYDLMKIVASLDREMKA